METMQQPARGAPAAARPAASRPQQSAPAAPGGRPPEPDPIETVKARMEFYRDGYRAMQKITLAAVVAALVGLCFGIGTLAIKPQPKYFPTGPGCKMQPLAPLSEPVVSDDDIMDKAVKTAQHTYSYDHLNWRTQFAETAKSYTGNGWKGVQAEFERTGNLEKVIKKRLVATAVAQTAPAVVDQYVAPGGVYTWIVRFDMLTLYRGSEGDVSQKVRVEAHIVRVMQDEIDSGVPIKVDSLKVGNAA